MVSIEQRITEAEYRAAYFLHLKPRPAFAAAIGAIALAAAGSVGFSLAAGGSASGAAGALLPVPALLALVFLVLVPYRLKKQFRENRLFSHKTTIQIGEGGFVSESELGTARIPWDHIRKWKCGRKILLLYPSDLQYFIFSRANFSDDQWREFRELVAARVGKG